MLGTKNQNISNFLQTHRLKFNLVNMLLKDSIYYRQPSPSPPSQEEKIKEEELNKNHRPINVDYIISISDKINVDLSTGLISSVIAKKINFGRDFKPDHSMPVTNILLKFHIIIFHGHSSVENA